MAKLPFLQLFTGDWLKDPKLSLCTAETRGVWIDLICAMHELDRSGELRGTREQLARLARCSTVELARALTDLQTTGAAAVTERNGIVTVTNFRMRREHDGRQSTAKRVDKYRRKKAGDAGAGAVTPAQRSRNGDISDTPAGVSSVSTSFSDTPPTPSRAAPRRAPPSGGGVGVSHSRSEFREEERAEYAAASCDHEGRVLGWGWVRASADGSSDAAIRAWHARGRPRDPRLAAAVVQMPRAPSTPAAEGPHSRPQPLTLAEARETAANMRELGRDVRGVIAGMPLDERDRERLLVEFGPVVEADEGSAAS